MNLCILSNKKPSYSETFINSHITKLSNTFFLYGRFFPRYYYDGKSLTKYPKINRLFSFLNKGLIYVFKPMHSVPPQASSTPNERNAFLTFLQNNNIKLVLAEYGPTAVAVTEVCTTAKVPLVAHFHGYDAYNIETLEKYQTSYTRLFQSAAAVIAVSRDMERQLLYLGADQEKLYYCPYGVDTKLFKAASPSQSSPLFLAVSRLVEKKGIHLTIKAFKTVIEQVPNAQLVIVGDGPQMNQCRNLVHEYRLSQSVDLRGSCSHQEVAEIMRQARAFVQHSLQAPNGDSEGTPVAILEAGASGLPVISTRHAGIVDVVLEHQTGFLVDEGDVNGMAEYMLKLAKDPHLASCLGRAARLRISAEFNIEKSIAKLQGIIDQITH